MSEPKAELVRADTLSMRALDAAEEARRTSGGRLSGHLARPGGLDGDSLCEFLTRQYNVPAILLSDFEIEPDVIALVPRDLAVRHQAVPVNRTTGVLIVAMSDPSDLAAIDVLRFVTGYRIEVVVTPEAELRAAIARCYDGEQDRVDWSAIVDEIDEAEVDVRADDAIEVNELASAIEDAPIVRLVNGVLIEAIRRGASDIHLEPQEEEFRVRYRIDGVLHDIMSPRAQLKGAIAARVKVMAKLDIAERRLPQDGRIRLRLGGKREMDYRVSVLPSMYGEKIVLRLLDKGALALDLKKLGFEAEPLARFEAAIRMPYGMCLVTGPTGSGKTTTLYSALAELNRSTINITTVEDPIEYSLRGITQVQVNEEIGMGFAACLRSFLRQDPNVIMVGEIRDFETAEIAVKASLTGHVVLSTLHTNDAPSTISRLLHMGIEPYLVTASLNAVVAQRLARRICGACKRPIEVSDAALLELGVTPRELGSFEVQAGSGCDTCARTGYKGRIAVYEVMRFDDDLKELVINGASAAELKTEAVRLGMQTLRRAALNKLVEGLISMDEVSRVSTRDTAPA